MENKTTTENTGQNATVQKTKSAIERQADIIVSAFERAKENGGILLNENQKTQPSFYQNGVKVSVSPFNSVILAMHSDENKYETNQMTLFSDAKKRGESVKSKENGVPFSWYAWNEYVNKSNPDDKISRHDYKALSPEEQSQYKGIRSNEHRILFNIDQTTLSAVHKEDYENAIKEHGGIQDREVSQKDDMKLRMSVNDFILNVRDNLVSIKKDGSGIASYDKQKDAVHLPAQNAYSSYSDYVQDMTRQVVSATTHPQRLNRRSSQTYDMLVTELASASKQLQYSLPAKLSPKAMEQIDNIIDSVKKNPKLIESIEHDVNASMGMIQKAANGEKVELRPTPKDMDKWRSRLPQEGSVPDKFDAVLMLRDNDSRWTLYVKPENESAFAIHPSQNDVSMFFNVIRNNVSEKTETFRQELAQKYYAQVAANPEKTVDLFNSNADAADLARIERVNIFKTKDDPSKILAVPVIDGERQKARPVSQDQWQRLWLAPDMQEYKKHLAATLYADILKGETQEVQQPREQVQNQGQQQANKQEQSETQKEPITLDIPKWSLNYIVNGDAEGITDEEKDIVDKFLDENFADGFIPEIIEGSDKDFNVSPAFGTRNPNALPNKGESPYQAVDTVSVTFSPAGYFETRDKDHGEKEKVQTEQKQEQEKKQEQEQEQRQAEKENKSKKIELSPMLKQFLDLKKKHPDALLLFRCGDFYETYKDDAEKASKILGITLTKSTRTKDDQGKPLAMAGFPYHALDTYLPKLIRAGQRVAICDQIEQPKQTTSRSSANRQAEQEQKSAKLAPKVEQQETQSRGFHR